MTKPSSWVGRGVWGVIVLALLLLLFLPAAVVVTYAFNGGSNLSWPPHGMSLRWFRFVFADSDFRFALRNSVTAAIWTSVIDIFVAGAAAFMITRYRTRWSKLLEVASFLPVIVPPLIIGLGLAVAMKGFGIAPSMYTVIAGHVVVTVPFVLLILVSRLREYDLTVDAAARDLGASPTEVLRRITLPQIAPSLAGATLIAAAISMDEVLVTNFTSGTTATLPLFVLSRMRRTIDPSVNVVATLLLLAPWLGLAVWFLVSKILRGTTSLRDITGEA